MHAFRGFRQIQAQDLMQSLFYLVCPILGTIEAYSLRSDWSAPWAGMMDLQSMMEG